MKYDPRCPYCVEQGEWCGCEQEPEQENDYGSGFQDEWTGQEIPLEEVEREAEETSSD